MSRIEMIGLSKLNAKMAGIERKAKPGLIRVTRRATLFVHSKIPGVPPRPPGSTYRRTNRMVRATTTAVKILGNIIAGVIGNNTAYAPDVISNRKIGDRGPQARVHRGRWYTLQNEVTRHRKAVAGMYRKYVQGLLK